MNEDCSRKIEAARAVASAPILIAIAFDTCQAQPYASRSNRLSKPVHKMNLEVLSQQPLRESSKSPVLLVHGAWHGAWCWKVYFADYLAQQGFQVHAISLRGHGNSEGRRRLRWTAWQIMWAMWPKLPAS